METKNIDELRANPKNPRIIKEHEFEALKESIRKFGDLSGIVFNVRTQQLVGGHQRTEAFRKLGGERRVVITQRFETPNRQGTVAIGHVEYDGELYTYREVDWDEGFEKAANIAANRIQGEFDHDLLAQTTYEISQLEDADALLALSGQTEREVKKHLEAVGALDTPPPEDQPPDDEPEKEKLEFSLTRDQKVMIEKAIEQIKATRELQATESRFLNGSALFVMAQDYLAAHPEAPAEPGELTDVPTEPLPQ